MYLPMCDATVSMLLQIVNPSHDRAELRLVSYCVIDFQGTCSPVSPVFVVHGEAESVLWLALHTCQDDQLAAYRFTMYVFMLPRQ